MATTFRSGRPRLAPMWGWIACAATVLVWGFLRVTLFQDVILPLPYALPLLVCVWTGSRRMLWAMAASLVVFSTIKIWWLMPADALTRAYDWAAYVSILINILIGAAVVHAIIGLHRNLEIRNDAMEQANSELEGANEELAAREKEITRQHEEVTAQADELHAANEELAQRESMLQSLLASHPLAGQAEVLGKLCAHGRTLLGSDVHGAVVAEARDERLRIQAQSGIRGGGGATDAWPLRQSLARLVMDQGQPAALHDVALRPDLVFPELDGGAPVRAALAAPLSIGGQAAGVVEFYSREPRPWTENQLRLARWVAAQCSTTLEMMREVERRERAEETLRQRAEEVERLLHVVPAAIWVASDPKCQMIVGNRRANEYYQASEGDNVSHSAEPGVRRFFTPDGRELSADELPMQVATATNRDVRDVEVIVQAPSGRRIAMLGSAVPLHNDAGQVRGCIGAFVEFTDRARAEKELKAAKQRLDAHMENSPLAVIEWGPDMRLTRWTREAERIFGWKADEVLGKRMWDFRWIHADDVPQVEDVSRDLIRGVQRFSANRNYRKDGTVVQCHWYNSTLVDESGQLNSILSLALDVTEQERTRQAMVEARALAEAANRAKDNFLAVLSHELRTPLNPALIAATILENSPHLAPDLREDVAIIRRNVELEARLIDDMLDLTRIVRGKLTLARRIVDGCQVLRYAVETCQAEAVEKSVPLDVVLPEEPIAVDADPARLQQVFWNLLKNAIKFTPAHGRITVTAARAECGGLRVEVRDTGRGIEPDALSRIFDAFEQGGSGITRRYGGLGLGLAICKSLVAMHDGSISAHSDGPGKGSRFVVELPPAAHCHDRDEPTSQAAPPQVAGSACRILLVEDHEMTAVLTARLLRSFGHVVTTADCVQGALDTFDREPFDLLISDLGLPDGNGQDLLRQLLQKRPIKAIALSGYGMDSDIRSSIERGFLEHLVKPINATQLEEAINRVLGSGDSETR